MSPTYTMKQKWYMTEHLGINWEHVVKYRTTRRRMNGIQRKESSCSSGAVKQRGEAVSQLDSFEVDAKPCIYPARQWRPVQQHETH